MEKYVVYLTGEKEESKTVYVEGRANIDGDGYLRFGRDEFVFARGSWSYFKKVKVND